MGKWELLLQLCNDLAHSAQVTNLLHRPPQGFSFPVLGEVGLHCKIVSNHLTLDWHAANFQSGGSL